MKYPLKYYLKYGLPRAIKAFPCRAYRWLMVLLTTPRYLSQLESKAKELGAKHARLGGTITDNPYCGKFLEDREFAEYCHGVSPARLLPSDYFGRQLTYRQRLARAYYLGFGEVIWEKMNKGYPPL